MAEFDQTMDVAIQIIDSSVDREAIFHEACSLSKKIKLESNKPQSGDLDISVEGFLSVTCQELQRGSMCSGGDAPPILTLAKQIIDLSRSCPSSGGPLLSPDVMKRLEHILLHLNKKTDDFWYDSSLFESLVIKHNLPLEMLWCLTVTGAMSLDSYFSSKLSQETSFVPRFSRELVSCCLGSADSFMRRQKILTGVTAYIIRRTFGEEKSPLKRSLLHLLDRILQDLLDLKIPANEVNALTLPTDFLSNQDIIAKEALSRFCVHALSCILSCQAECGSNGGVSDVLKSGTDWSSVHVDRAARELIKQLFLPLSCEAAAMILLQSFDQTRISGTLTLVFLSALYASFQDAAAVMNGHIQKKLLEGLASSDIVKLSAAFLLARQTAVVVSDGARNYSSWFETTFGDERSAAATRSAFICLIRFLSSLVPFDSAEFLKVHILKRPMIPSKCRNLYDDYIGLAKTRLQDLKVPLHDLSKGLFSSSTDGTIDKSNKKPSMRLAEEDVERVIKVFCDTGKLPTVILEASIFRKPYFIKKFLPALLKPRCLPDIPDQRMKLISEISRAGKIPSTMYNNYLQECNKEKQMLEGVFDIDDEYELVEMALPPLRQLSLRLDSYVRIARTENQTKVADCLSQVVEKVIDVLSVPSAGGTSSGLGSVWVDLGQPLQDNVFVQVASEVICHVRVLIRERSQSEVSDVRLRCLVAVHQLIGCLLKEAPELQSAFCQHILTHLGSQDPLDVTTAASVCACLMTSPSPLNVKSKDHDSMSVQRSHKNILEAVAEWPSLNPQADLECRLRFWTDYVTDIVDLQEVERQRVEEHGVVEVSTPCWFELSLLPGNVTKEIQLLCRRLDYLRAGQKETRMKVLVVASTCTRLALSDPRWSCFSRDKCQCTLSDWVTFELAVEPQRDMLLPPERPDFMWEMSQQFMEKPGLARDPLDLCSQILKILAVQLADSSRYKYSVADKVPDNFMCFVSLLSKHLLKLPHPDSSSHVSWLASILEPDEAIPYMNSLLRLAVELPAHILFCSSTCQQRISSSHVSSALFVIDHFINSSINRGGYFSQQATIFIIQGLIWAQQSTQQKPELDPLLTHAFVATSFLTHKKVLEDSGLLQKLGTGWTRQMDIALQWAERFVDSNQTSATNKSLDVRHLAAALFVVLLHRDCHVAFQDYVIRSNESIFVCVLELMIARLVSQSLRPDSDSLSSNVLVTVAVQIFSVMKELAAQLLDASDHRWCPPVQGLGLGQRPESGFWKDYHILRLAAQRPFHLLPLTGTTSVNVTDSVVKAYIRVHQYARQHPTQLYECLEGCHQISRWIKELVDHTQGDQLCQIITPEGEVFQADILLFRYIKEKKKGWV